MFCLQLTVEDQLLLLKTCCLEIMCLRLVCRYDPVRQAIVLPSGASISHRNIDSVSFDQDVQSPITPLLELAASLAKLQLDKTEIALLAAVLLVRSGKLIPILDIVVVCENHLRINF